VITALTSNGMIEPSYWIDPKTRNNYMLTVQCQTLECRPGNRSQVVWYDRADPSAPQEVHLVGPVHIPRLASESNQSADQSSNVCRRDCLFIDKDHTAMGSFFFCPEL